MQLVYFARVREAIGRDGEERKLPENVETIADCLDWLAKQNAVYATAFADRSRLRFTLDQHLVRVDAALGDARELAIFPPVTGG